MNTIQHTNTIEDLTNRQTDIVSLVAKGMSNEEIATMLSISSKTVKNHVTTVNLMLGTKNKVQLTLWYLAQIGALK